MGGKMARNKGQRAEREVIKLLQVVVNETYAYCGKEPPELQRNLMQTMEGGFDVIGLEWFALEVKHQETFHLNAWWKQAVAQAGENQEPYLLYRKNRVKWRARFNAEIIDGITALVDIDFQSFTRYFSRKIYLTINSA